nr:MAG TPA: hypothetical protein [Caudoviricetes sp.]
MEMGDFAPLLTHHCPTASPLRFFAICFIFSDLLYFGLIFLLISINQCTQECKNILRICRNMYKILHFSR